jgi:hypothetical protein
MVGHWVSDLESFVAINQDAAVRQVVLRMADLARGGRLGSFVDAVHGDDELDAQTKDTILELARETSFLLAAEEYMLATRRFH